MSTINRNKLMAMGEAKLRAACIKHATKAIEFTESGQPKKANIHCALLDQCASAGRELLGGPQFTDLEARKLVTQMTRKV